MAAIVVMGGGMCGLTSAMMLARRGHSVTVLERNDAEPPDDLETAWEEWERPGCGQFRMGHWFLARFRHIIDAELPDLTDAFRAAGALETSVTEIAPPMPWDPQDDDDRFRLISGRRPVFEWVVADAAAREPGLEIRRGVAVTGLVTGTPAKDGIPHVTGVVTDTGDTLSADVVIDAGGRRSPLPQMLAAIGARPMHEESEDCGFRYYGRYFRSRDGGFPGPGFASQFAGAGVTGLVLPADNHTWMLGIATSTKDKALYGLTDETRWSNAIASFEGSRPWLDGEPMSEIETMVGIPDRFRRLVVDGEPVATGVLLLGDAWAATNPSLGRGVSMGLIQAQCVMDAIESDLDDPYALSMTADALTERDATPFYRATLEMDRGTLAGIDALLAGQAPPEPDPGTALFMKTRFLHQDVFRAFGDAMNLLVPPDELITEPLIEAMLTVADADPVDLGPVPTRQELVDIASA